MKETPQSLVLADQMVSHQSVKIPAGHTFQSRVSVTCYRHVSQSRVVIHVTVRVVSILVSMNIDGSQQKNLNKN